MAGETASPHRVSWFLGEEGMAGWLEGGESSKESVWLLLLSGTRPHVAPNAIKSSARDPWEMQRLTGTWIITPRPGS